MLSANGILEACTPRSALFPRDERGSLQRYIIASCLNRIGTTSMPAIPNISR